MEANILYVTEVENKKITYAYVVKKYVLLVNEKDRIVTGPFFVEESVLHSGDLVLLFDDEQSAKEHLTKYKDYTIYSYSLPTNNSTSSL